MEKMERKIRKGGVLAAAFVLLVLAAAPRVAHGALAVDVDAECSMDFTLGNDYAELGTDSTKAVPVAVYRVGAVSASGAYTAEQAYAGIGLEGVNASTTAEQWQQMAEAAAEIAAGREAGWTAEVGKDGGTVGDLPVGMYLVVASEVQSAEYAYSFEPSLVSLPMNYYYTDGDDAWQYDVAVSLKPDQTERLGALRITKELTSWRAGDTVPFIFRIEAVKTEADGTSRKVYSDTVQMVFDGPGSQEVIVKNIPAGAVATVTEVYRGADYDMSGPAPEPVPIVAYEDAQNAVPLAGVTFANAYNNGLNGGSSIVNNFVPAYETDADGMPVVGEDGSKKVVDWKWERR